MATKNKKFCLIFSNLLFLILLSGCVSLYDPESSQDYHSDIIATLTSNQQVVQTITSRNPGFCGIEFWMSFDLENTTDEGLLELSFYKGETSTRPFFQTSIYFNGDQENHLQKIKFQPQFDPANHIYRIVMQSKQGTFRLWGKNENIYVRGEAARNGEIIDSDMGFRLIYDYSPISFLQDLLATPPSWWLIIPVAITLFLPGWIILNLAGFRDQLDFGEIVAFALGLSISFYAVLFTWTSSINFHWNKTSILILGICILLIGGFYLFRYYFDHKPISLTPLSLVLMSIFLIGLSIRLIMIRDLAAPPWVDSIHNGLITHLILDTGSLPYNYLPYLNVKNTAYHTGFHILAAIFIWLTRLEIHKAILLVGQLLNAISIFSIYNLALSLTKNQIGAVISAALVAFVSPMPAYYTSWGRYPQLTGLIMLPIVFTLFRCIPIIAEDISSRKPGPKPLSTILLCSFSLAALTLTHYRVSALFFCLLAADFLFNHLPLINQSKSFRVWKTYFSYISIAMVLASAFLIPWLSQALKTLIIPRLFPPVSIASFTGINFDYLTSGFGEIVIFMAIIGFLIALLERKQFLIILIMGFGLTFFLANMGNLNLPGSNFINNNFFMISLFIPLTILGGYSYTRVLSVIQYRANSKLKQLTTIISYAILIASLSLGAWKLISILNPITFLAREADFIAMPEINKLTKTDDQILINPFLWGYNLYAGADGGYWISTTAKRATIPYPVIYGFSNDRNYIKHVNMVNDQVIKSSDDASAIAEIMRQNHIKYLYLGARGGIISSRQILQYENFIVRYHQDSVWLFELVK